MALAIMVTAMGFLGAQLVRGLDMADYAEQQLRVSQMTERVLALVEFDPEIQTLLMSEDDRLHEFDRQEPEAYWGLRRMFPEYGWRVQANRVNRESDELWQFTVEILYQPDPEKQGDLGDAEVVRQVALLRAKPAKFSLEDLTASGADLSQAGLSEDQLGQLQDLLSAYGGMDLDGVSLQQLIQLIGREELQQYMPMIQAFLAQMGGGLSPAVLQGLLQSVGGLEGLGIGGAGGVSEEDVRAALEQLSEMGGEGGGAAGLGGPGMRGPGRPGAGNPGMGPPRPPGGIRPGGGRPGGMGPGGAGPGVQPGGGPRSVGGGQVQSQGGGVTIEELMRAREEYERERGTRK